jgi:hypothetical protein
MLLLCRVWGENGDILNIIWQLPYNIPFKIPYYRSTFIPQKALVKG